MLSPLWSSTGLSGVSRMASIMQKDLNDEEFGGTGQFKIAFAPCILREQYMFEQRSHTNGSRIK